MMNYFKGLQKERTRVSKLQPGDTVSIKGAPLFTVRELGEPYETDLGPFVAIIDTDGRTHHEHPTDLAYRVVNSREDEAPAKEEPAVEEKPEPEQPPRRPGRPQIGPATNVRLGEELTAKVDATRGKFETRAEAIRRLLTEAVEPVVVQYDEQTYEIPNYRIELRAHGRAAPHHAEEMADCTLDDVIAHAKQLLADDLGTKFAWVLQRTGVRKQRAKVATVYDRRRPVPPFPPSAVQPVSI